MDGKARAEKVEINTDTSSEKKGFDAFAKWDGGLEAFCQPSDADRQAGGNRAGFRDCEDD